MKKPHTTDIRLFGIFLAIGLFAQALSGAVFAAGFTDTADIGYAYKEAVEEMAKRGVINGFPNGSFLPEGTLTREQGAKIITYMILGGGVDLLTCDDAPFEDVAADRWSAPCIAWCAGRKILLGYGNGRYGPEDTLTGDQFAKMLLCALDLAREGNYEGLGSTWYSAVREDALTAGLYAGDAFMAIDQPISRQQAALMARNAAKAAQTETPSEPVTSTEPVTPTVQEPVASVQTPESEGAVLPVYIVDPSDNNHDDNSDGHSDVPDEASSEEDPGQDDDNETSMMTGF